MLKIRTMRKTMGLTQVQCSKILNISPKTFRNFEQREKGYRKFEVTALHSLTRRIMLAKYVTWANADPVAILISAIMSRDFETLDELTNYMKRLKKNDDICGNRSGSHRRSSNL